MKPKTRPSASAADDKDNPGSAPISADEIRVIMREELANVIANELGPRLIRVEEQLAQVVGLKDSVVELEKAAQHSADVHEELQFGASFLTRASLTQTSWARPTTTRC